MPKEQNVLSSAINQYLAAHQSGFLATVEILTLPHAQCRMLRCQCRVSFSSSVKYVDVPLRFTCKKA